MNVLNQLKFKDDLFHKYFTTTKKKTDKHTNKQTKHKTKETKNEAATKNQSVTTSFSIQQIDL